MIDLEGVPLPDDAPESGSCIRIERPEAGLVRLHLEPPHRPRLAVFDVPLLRDLDAALEEVAKDTSVKGLVIAGREPLAFAGGADVETIASFEDPAHVESFVREGQALFQRLAEMGRERGGRIRTVAAVGGPVPGGACEISLACDRILLAEHPKTKIGLPEVMLGIFPAWGGSQRLPGRIGVPAALQSILSGRLHPAKKAWKMGIVDRLTKPEYLWEIGDEIAMGRVKCARKGRSGWRLWLIDKNPLAGAVIASQARKGVMKQTRGKYPAPLAVLPLVVRAPRIRMRTGLAAELEAVKPLASSPVSRSLVGLFLLSEEAKKLGNLPDGTKAKPFTRGAVIGGGVMGGAIASVMAEKGFEARLRDLDPAALDAALGEHRQQIGRKQKRRRITRAQANGAFDRLETTTEAIGFSRCDLAIEAVAERLDVKRAVLGELANLMGDDAVLATNTSSLSVDEIAETIPHPERVIGLHFFNPVRRMPLVEIVRGSKTSDEVVARAARFALDLGKTPVVTRDVAGFLVNRLLGPYLDEAVRLVEQGADPAIVDAALVDFGMPMGPLELIDEVGLDIAAHAAASLEAAYGERMVSSKWLQPLVDAGQLGKKTGAGIYLWSKGKKGKPTNAGPNPKRPATAGDFTLTTGHIVDRLVLAMVNEGARCLEEEVVAGARELDLATVFGTGFAPFRGGLLRHADTVGASEIVDRLQQIHASPDVEKGGRRGRFEPAKQLVTLDEAKDTFHA